MTAAIESPEYTKPDWMREACQALAAKGYTTIAIGVMLGIGQQRVSEILRRTNGQGSSERETLSAGPFGGVCEHCGYRAATKAGHPLGRLSKKPVCTLPPEMRAGEL